MQPVAHTSPTSGSPSRTWATSCGLAPDQRVFAAVADIRRHGVRTCLLSNSWGLAVYPLELLAPVFDGIVISGEVGMQQPDLDIFLHAAETIGVPPRRCVFVDASPVNFGGAEEAGMTVLHHRTPDMTRRALERLLDVGLGSHFDRSLGRQ